MANEASVKLKLGPASWRYDGFDPSIKGVPVITHDENGIEVPAGKAEEVKKKAREQGFSVSEVKEEGS